MTISLVLCSTSIASAGVVMSFEGVADPGQFVNVDEVDPYSEAGFTLTPTNFNSAVFDAAANVNMPGNDDSSFFGWEENNIITLTRDNGGFFGIENLLFGPSSVADGPVSITIVAHFNGGATENMTFSSLDTAVMAEVGWVNLIAVDFRVTDDSAMDNLNLNFVPTPGALGLLALSGLGVTRRRRR